jgi:hypothetical protein
MLNSHVDFSRREETGEPGENPRSIGENNTSNKLNSHRTFGTTVVKDNSKITLMTGLGELVSGVIWFE